MASSSVAKPDMGKPQFASHGWVEPIVVISIMVGSLVLNRKRGFRIVDTNRGRSPNRALMENLQEARSSESSPDFDPLLDDADLDHPISTGHPPKKRNCCFTVVQTPNSSRFADHFHSRVLQKFPFLVEMFYWALNLAVYSLTKAIAQYAFSGQTGMRELAESHGIFVLDVEHKSFLRIFYPIHEASFQAWFLNGHTTMITFLNRIYSLVHIPGTVTFLSWYYYAAPNFNTFSTVRRTMSLGNFIAFFIFTLWPCMPPRLLPTTYGFHDTVRQENAESVWVGGKFVNQLAAMPSLHFTYAFVIGSTFLYHSGIARRLQHGEAKKSAFTQILFLVLGIAYPLLVLTVIVATANHYFADATVAMITTTFAFFVNKIWFVFLPLEDLMLWVLRLEKPVPSTGDRDQRRQRRRGGRGWRQRKNEGEEIEQA